MADEEGRSSSPGLDGQESANRNNETTNLRPTTTTSEKKTTKTKTVAEPTPKAKTYKQSSSDYNSPSDRFLILSKPKVRSEFHIRTEFSRTSFDPTNSCVYNRAALRAESSERIDQLAIPKRDYKGYVFAKPIETVIPPPALHATASDRVHELARPKTAKISPFA